MLCIVYMLWRKDSFVQSLLDRLNQRVISFIYKISKYTICYLTSKQIYCFHTLGKLHTQCTHAYVHASMQVCLHTHAHKHTHTHTYIYLKHTHTNTHTHQPTHKHIYIYIYIKHAHTHIHMHTHTHTHTYVPIHTYIIFCVLWGPVVY